MSETNYSRRLVLIICLAIGLALIVVSFIPNSLKMDSYKKELEDRGYTVVEMNNPSRYCPGRTTCVGFTIRAKDGTIYTGIVISYFLEGNKFFIDLPVIK